MINYYHYSGFISIPPCGIAPECTAASAAAKVHIFLSSDAAMGTASIKESTSAQACVISTPNSPKNLGRIRIRGIKKIPFREEDVMEAFSPFPMDCSIIFARTMVAISGRVTACARSATVPTAMKKNKEGGTGTAKKAPGISPELFSSFVL